VPLRLSVLDLSPIVSGGTAREAERLGVSGEIEGVVERVARSAAGGDGREVEDGEAERHGATS